jgi:hypothetical protein
MPIFILNFQISSSKNVIGLLNENVSALSDQLSDSYNEVRAIHVKKRNCGFQFKFPLEHVQGKANDATARRQY